MNPHRTQPIRTGRLLLAGLVTGLIINIGEAALHAGILADATTAAYAALNRTIVPDPVNLASLIAVTFAQGVLMAWLYGFIRPRFAGRSSTAVFVGLAAWLLSSVYSAVYLHSGLPGIFPPHLVWIPVAWELAEYPLAILAGAAMYGE